MPTEREQHTHPGAVAALSAAAAFTAGVLFSFQSVANGTLSTAFGHALDAALWSFVSGWALLTVGLLLASGRRGLARAGAAYRAGHLRWWHFLGGLGGGLFVAMQTWVVPQVGVALFTIAIVGGQTANALLVDKLGLGPGGHAPVTPARVLAALGTFVGVAVAVLARSDGPSATPLLAVLLTVAAGAGMALQAAFNGRVNRHTATVVVTSWINFSAGIGLLLGWAGVLLVQGDLHPPLTWSVPWWAFLGGVVGIVIVAVGAVVVHHLGVLLTTLFTLTGQMTSAVVADLLRPGADDPVPPQLLLGVGLTLVSAVCAGLAAQGTRRRRPAD